MCAPSSIPIVIVSPSAVSTLNVVPPNKNPLVDLDVESSAGANATVANLVHDPEDSIDTCAPLGAPHDNNKPHVCGV